MSVFAATEVNTNTFILITVLHTLLVTLNRLLFLASFLPNKHGQLINYYSVLNGTPHFHFCCSCVVASLERISNTAFVSRWINHALPFYVLHESLWKSTAGAYTDISVRSLTCHTAMELTWHIWSHSVTCHPTEVTFPPLPQPKLVFDYATPERCKAELTQLACYIRRWYTHPKTVTHPGTNRAWRALIRWTPLTTTPRHRLFLKVFF